MTDLNDLAYDCNELSRRKGWLDEKRTFGDYVSLMHSELSEALEEYRNGRDYDEVYYNESADDINKPEGIPIELADCIIRILQFCGEEGIDIQEAYELKMQYNGTRPHRHGGKVI